jgi:alcohol dehydrogenase class IV
LVHAIEYPIGAITHCSHGEGNGLLLPYVMEFNKPNCEVALAKIATLLTGTQDGSCCADDAIDCVRALQAKIGIRARLSELGLRAEHIPIVASKAVQIERLMAITARRPTESDLVAMLTKAM